MSKYSEKVAARRIQAQIDLAVRITDGGQPAPAPMPPAAADQAAPATNPALEELPF